jgi:uncharacterized protein YjbI with pentapeptide repeats
MFLRKSGWAIAVFTWSVIALGCNQRTQSLYKIEVERACRECDLRGVDLSRQSLGGKYRVSVSNQPLSTNPKGLGYAQPVDLTGSDLRQADLSDASLVAVIFNDTQLANANFSHANLQEAQFINADLSGANLQGAQLDGTNFQNADLSGADLRECDLSAANLTGANLTDALR